MHEKQNKIKLEIANNKSKIMLSQIQPHFLYNAIWAIMAIDGNPDETVDALGAFGKYLRENLNTLTSSDLVSLSSEMQHVKGYVSLEKIRFKDKIDVIYNLSNVDFKLPTLTVQILVENAIKHGITPKVGGGRVIISTNEMDDAYEIIVEDDGVGFDFSNPFKKCLCARYSYKHFFAIKKQAHMILLEI